MYNLYIRLLLQGNHVHLLPACNLLHRRHTTQDPVEQIMYNKLLRIIVSVKLNQHLVRQYLSPKINYLHQTV